LLYTTILSPLFYFNVIRHKRKTYFLPFGYFLITYGIIHLYAGVNIKSFVISNALFILTFFCVISFYHFINNYRELPKLFKQILLSNAVLVVIAIPFFFFSKEYQQWFWYINQLTPGLAEFPRLALFTYEASYYSLLLIPIFCYYAFKFLFKSITHNKWVTVLLVTIPLILSFSFGVIGALLLSAIVVSAIHFKKWIKYKRTFTVFALILSVSVIATTLLFFYFPQNFIVVRIQNIISGHDTSANGRTIDSFSMAWRVAASKNIFFGAGLGQIKIITIDLVHRYYNYWGIFPRYDIPNAMGETLAIFGIVGVVFRMVLEWYLFFKTKVYSNYYRLTLFIFIFIYQFTGSFISNIVEYVIWIIAFSSVFEQFNIVSKQKYSFEKSNKKNEPLY
jgi:hypothetical protein